MTEVNPNWRQMLDSFDRTKKAIEEADPNEWTEAQRLEYKLLLHTLLKELEKLQKGITEQLMERTEDMSTEKILELMKELDE